MEAAAELIVHAAAGHLAKREQHHVERFLVFGARVVAEQEVMHGDARKFGSSAEAAEARIEGAAEDGEAALQSGGVERRAGAVGRHFHLFFELLDHVARGLVDLFAIARPSLRDLGEDGAEARDGPSDSRAESTCRRRTV